MLSGKELQELITRTGKNFDNDHTEHVV